MTGGAELEAEPEDIRPVRVAWADLEGTLEGGRRRGMSQEQIDFFTSGIGYVWSRAARTGRAALAAGQPQPPVLAAAIAGVVASALACGWSPPHLDYLQSALGLVWAASVWRVWLDAGAPIAGGLGGAATAAQIADRLACSPPTVALSLIQPWGWVILYGGKRLENRTRRLTFPRSPIFLHASAGMSRKYYDETIAMVAEIAPGLVVPQPEALERGGIIGQARIVSCAANDLTPQRERDPWAMRGQYGYRLVDVRPLRFVPCAGMLGFWKVPEDVAALALGDVPELEAVGT